MTAARLRRRVVEIDDLAEFDAAARGAHSLAGWRIRHVDLRDRTAELGRLDPAGALLLGCRLEADALARLQAGGALIYPSAPEVPVDEYRSSTYTPDELYAGLEHGYGATPDATIYAWSQDVDGAGGDTSALAVRALHDASIESALDDVITSIGRPVVGVMGGHAVERGSGGYREAAELGRALARSGFLVATGGGPGAMEAVNLGASLAAGDGDAHDDGNAVLDAAVELLAAVASFRPSVTAWAGAAQRVRRELPAVGPSLGVPTWFYGHEPPNLFASHIAKFFQNAVREAVLLDRCTGGIVVLPGAAGTVQEVFQDACENYYADAAQVAPMVLVGRRHWTETLPAWPLLQSLAEGRAFAAAIALVDTAAEAAELVADFHRSRPRSAT